MLCFLLQTSVAIGVVFFPFRANLSRDYFVNRQDRYLKFKSCPQLADYFADLVETVASHSFTLKADGSTDPTSAVPVDPLSSRRAARTFSHLEAK